MTKHSELVVGWCPGALKPMESGDGLIVRVRPRLGLISLGQLETLANAAARYGDGNLYLSNRANIQIRAVKPEDHAPLLKMLGVTGLIDSDPQAEAVRNVMLVPGFGPGAQPGMAAELARQLEALIVATQPLHSLPGKFGVAVQTGGSIDTGAITDVTFLVQNSRISMMLDGDLSGAVIFDTIEAATEGYLRAAIAFLKAKTQDPEIRRVRTLLRKLGIGWIAKEASLGVVDRSFSFEEPASQAGDLGGAFGLAFPFGEVSYKALQEIAATMHAQGLEQVAISPHRGFVFPCAERDKATLQDLADRIGAVTNAEDIRLRVHGCPGEPACLRATVPARRDAEEVVTALAGIAFRSGSIHISGCEKRCAHPNKATITAIGAEGSYTVTGPQRSVKKVAPKDLAATVLSLASTLP